MARFAIDARVLTTGLDGVGRYARELIPALAAAARGDEFLVLRHPSNRQPLAGAHQNVREVYVEGVMGRLVGHYLSDHARLRRVFDAHGWPDVYHALFHMCARAFPGARRPRPAVVLTVHDLIWLERPFAHGPAVGGAGTWLAARIGIAGSLRRADRTIAVSEATASAARRFVAPGRLSVVHHGVGAAFREPPPPLPGTVAGLLAGSRPWIAAVGNSKQYKNLDLLLRAFARACSRGLDASLVLMGRCNALQPRARGLAGGDRFIFTGEVGDDVLRAVVGRAALFVHPALVEGFGMPVVEAMALGAPTAVADVPVLAEVGGDGVLRFGPHDEEALAGLIERFTSSEQARHEWSARARRRAEAFDWSTCARETLAVYRAAMGDA